MIKVLKEKPTEVKERYYSLEDIKNEKFVCSDDGERKFIVAMESIQRRTSIDNTSSSVPILSVENLEATYRQGDQHQFRVFSTKREMFLWLAED